MSAQADHATHRWRKFLRFSVRGLIVVVLVIGAGLAWIVRQAHIQRDAVAAIENAGGSVSYNWEWTYGNIPWRAKPRHTKWLADLIGVDYVYHVTTVTLSSPRTASNVAMSQIGRLTQLEQLSLHDTFLTDEGLAHLGRLTSLMGLALSNDQIPDTGLSRLKGLFRLRALSLHGTYISDARLAHLSGLVSLESLVLSNTEITDAGLVQLQRLASLTDLDLSGTHITAAGLVHLERLVKLSSLNLSGTRVTSAGVAQLSRLISLKRLILRSSAAREW